MQGMIDARLPCEHRRYDAHNLPYDIDPTNDHKCPGGSPVTTADLEGLGEKVWWCSYESSIWHNRNTPPVQCDSHDGRCGWRILIPIPETQEGK